LIRVRGVIALALGILHRAVKIKRPRLENVELVRNAHPRTFSIPRKDERCSLKVGQLVNLMFLADFPGQPGPRAERMWVKITELRMGRLVGALTNMPRVIPSLTLGDLIEFGPENVASVYGAASEARHIDLSLTAVVSESVLNGAWPASASRQRPVNPTECGWIILAAEETADATNLSARALSEVIDLFPVLDTIITEPVGSSWRWNEAEREYGQS
jgi:hypothetical protein